MRFPRPLRPGDTIGVTSPSAGVQAPMRPRFDAAVAALRARGFEVEVGECMSADRVVSAPKEQRAAELTRMLCDPAIAAVVPPWGGELGIDLLDQLDWEALATAEPTWAVGYSDTSVWLTALTTRLDWATLHGTNLMDTPYDPPAGLLHWTEIAGADPNEPIVQRAPGRYRDVGRDDWIGDPGVSTMSLDREGGWSVLGGGDADVTGRLIGGCVEIMGPVAGTAYADIPRFAERYANDGLIVFLEAAEAGPHDVARALHGLRYAGWFDRAEAVLIGRTTAPGLPDMSQHEAVADALGMLECPVVLDVDCGHAQPQTPLVSGASARVVTHTREITQTLA